MNNDPLDSAPVIPDNVQEWPLYSLLHGCVTNFGKSDVEKFMFRLKRRTLLSQMKLMANTQCVSCGGFGHRARDCPTHKRIGMLGACSFEDMKLIAWARASVLVDNRNR